MELIVSSSLEGRDLALLKSVINILHSDYAGEADYNWQYQEGINHQIFVSQDFYKNTTEYYALVKDKGTRFSLGSQINPRNLRKLFEQLSAGHAEESIDKASNAIVNDKASFLKHLFKYMSTQTPFKMSFIGESGCHIIIDKKEDRMISNVPLNPSMMHNQLFDKKVQINYQDAHSETEGMKFRCQASHFLWNLGVIQTNELILPEFKEPRVTFKQIKWPDYGSVTFKNSFISMSALLLRQAESYESLNKNHVYEDEEVIAFLNAMSLSGTCAVTTNTKDKVVSIKAKEKKNTGFLNKLKQKFFGKSA